ncbi:MAG: sterol desaturase family protein, partial [Spirochaetales bacterium]|nr:sterol desaturase family protein [Spirochaetales bacterium]
MALWEVIAPRRRLVASKAVRWVNNIGLVVLNSFVLRLLFTAAAVGVASFASAHGWGLLNYYPTPFALAVIVSVITLDLMIYLQHVMVHAVPALWRFHRVHHADPDFDVTTGARFHPIEIILSMLIKFAAIAVLGPPVLAVIIFEVLLNATAMFNHSNVRMPVSIDKVLRLFVVTPDMHRVHHSVEDDEANSNFGFNLPWWDRLFGT